MEPIEAAANEFQKRRGARTPGGYHIAARAVVAAYLKARERQFIAPAPDMGANAAAKLLAELERHESE